MRLLFVLLSLLLSAPCFALYECHERGRVILSSAPCDTTWVPLARYGIGAAGHNSASSVTLRPGLSNNYFMSGTVQGRIVQFMVDTGASRISISAHVAAAAGLGNCKDAGISHTANGSVRVCESIASEITFGPFRMIDVPVTVLPNMAQDALLGMDALRQFKLEQRAGQLTISR